MSLYGMFWHGAVRVDIEFMVWCLMTYLEGWYVLLIVQAINEIDMNNY